MIKHLYLRCIGSEKVGIGHIKRIEVISHLLIQSNVPNTIIVKNHSSMVKNNYNFLLMPPNQNLFLESSSFLNLPNVQNLLDEAQYLIKYLPEDSFILYDISNKNVIENINPFRKYFSDLSKKFNLLILDSINNESVSDIINKNVFKKIIIPYEVVNTTKDNKNILVGLKYLTLNKNLFLFKNRYKNKYRNFNIVVCFGGSDPYFLNRYFLKLISHYKKRRIIKILIIFGPLINKKEKKMLMYEIKKLNIRYIDNPNNIYDLISKSSVAVTSTGIMKYELAKIGIPTVMITHNIQSLENNEGFAKKNTGITLNKTVPFQKNLFKLNKFLNNKLKLQWFSKNGHNTFPQNSNNVFIKTIKELITK
jgi:spore coat polysaccharide biosynthesis predicted glycosyltransferase SpsG